MSVRTKKRQEEDKEQHRVDDKLRTYTRADGIVVHVVVDVERTKDARKENNGQTENHHPRIEQYVETTRSIGPL